LRHSVDRKRIRVRATADPILDAPVSDLDGSKEMLKFSHDPPAVRAAQFRLLDRARFALPSDIDSNLEGPAHHEW
jgi:hypothetical protein